VSTIKSTRARTATHDLFVTDYGDGEVMVLARRRGEPETPPTFQLRVVEGRACWNNFDGSGDETPLAMALA